jgi:hypothetical protein
LVLTVFFISFFPRQACQNLIEDHDLHYHHLLQQNDLLVFAYIVRLLFSFEQAVALKIMADNQQAFPF